jgi:SAM-dependent methyltransferase
MKDWHETKATIEDYYKSLIEGFGTSPRACDYGHPNSQQIKFEVLAGVKVLNRKTVLDVGCGFASFASYLSARYAHVEYTGIDITKDFVDYAKNLNPILDLKVLDIMEEDPGSTYDLVTANGIFYLLGESAEEKMQALIKRMFELCREAVAFNSLSSWCLDQESNEFYADPVRTVEFCRTLTPWVTLRHDYHPRDFTVFLYKDKNS